MVSTPDDGGVQIKDVMSLCSVKMSVNARLVAIHVNVLYSIFLHLCYIQVKFCIAFKKNSRTTKPFVKQKNGMQILKRR